MFAACSLVVRREPRWRVGRVANHRCGHSIAGDGPRRSGRWEERSSACAILVLASTPRDLLVGMRSCRRDRRAGLTSIGTWRGPLQEASWPSLLPRAGQRRGRPTAPWVQSTANRGSSTRSPSVSTCSISERACSIAAIVFGAAYPATWISDAMSTSPRCVASRIAVYKTADNGIEPWLNLSSGRLSAGTAHCRT